MMTGSHSQSLAFAEFFQQRFALGDIIGAEIPVTADLKYAVAMDTVQNKLYCSCPFFPKPCTHALALSAFYQREGPVFFPLVSAPPDWLDALLTGQSAITLKTGASAEQRAAKQQQTRFERLERAANGFEDLDAWLSDTVRRGLATVISEEPAALEHIASRAADASMTGLSRYLRLLAKIPVDAPDWAEQVSAGLAETYLAVRAFQNRALLPEALLHDLQQFIGIAIKKEDVLASGERLKDSWAVLGSLTEILEDKLSMRRTWMLGAESGRMALLLDYAFGGGGFTPGFTPGSIQHGSLVFYPSAYPQRALLLDDVQSISQQVEHMPGHETLESFLTDYAAALAVQPWLPTFAVVLLQVIPGMEKSTRFFLTDSTGKTLPLNTSERSGWALLALSGGAPISVFGEWNGQTLRPVSALAEGRLVSV